MIMNTVQRIVFVFMMASILLSLARCAGAW